MSILEKTLTRRGWTLIQPNLYETSEGRVPVVYSELDLKKAMRAYKRVVFVHEGIAARRNAYRNEVYVEHFAKNEACMLVDLTSNVRASPLRVWTDAVPYEKAKLPRIKADDVQARLAGAQVGNVLADGADRLYIVI